ncbi:hypothetical protein [Dapis sp. BLCC M229]|uniref:hypothetical protein n=1 Tax=Dapis sp. BLCC M229 TaxID=3400188 RepID=UPI003CF74893
MADKRLTSISLIVVSACQRSYWVCWLSQLLADVPKALESCIASFSKYAKHSVNEVVR